MLSKKYDNKRNILFISLFILSIVYVLIFFRPSVIDFDESYTISLINDSWDKLFYFDSLDVHPPLYYLLLKSFIGITTFWTDSIPIEVLLSRLFSIIVSIISFMYLYKLLELFDIKNNVCIQWLLMILLPNVLGFKFSTQQLVDIRMYSLAAMFIIILFYYLIKFYYSGKNVYLIISTLSAMCAVYTHYYSAIFSGLFFVYYLFIFVRYHNGVKIRKLCVSIFVLILSFIPWFPIFIKQLNNSNTYWMSRTLELKEIIEFIIIFLLFFYPIYKYSKLNHKSTNLSAIFFVIIFTFFFSLAYSLLRRPMFQYRYMFPILLIYEFISLNILYKYIKYRKLYIYSLIIFVLLFCNFSISLVDQVVNVYPSSINSVKVYNYLNRNKHRRIIINNNHNDFNYVTYIPKFHKQFIVPKSFKTESHIYGNNDYKITFNNVIQKLRYK